MPARRISRTRFTYSQAVTRLELSFNSSNAQQILRMTTPLATREQDDVRA